MIGVRGLLVCLTCLFACEASGDRKIIQIGGGNKVDNSQGQIEDNVIWLSEILRRSSDDVINFFAAGKQGVKDVSLYGDITPDPVMEPIARVFGKRNAERLVFKSNQVPDVSGAMNKDELIPALEGILEGLGKNTDLLLIYNGHGEQSADDIRLNALKTWSDGRLNVAEMDGILDHAPEDMTVRLIFPQCYSGGFYYLIYDDPDSSEISAQNRCGFFSESPYEESEGCSLNTNKEEYRDYSTYFFAPLNGTTRNGRSLPIDPDRNGDSMISFRESHIYSLMVAESKDLPRSTSEMYLEQWEPWYLRWSRENNRESVYWDIAEYVAVTHELSLEDKELAAVKAALQNEMDAIARKLGEVDKAIGQVAAQIRREVVLKWPEVEYPYTPAYLELMSDNATSIAAVIRAVSGYEELVRLQNQIDDLNAQELGLEREITLIDKINRMKRLARLEGQFYRFAGEDEIQAYDRLLECERGVFFSR